MTRRSALLSMMFVLLMGLAGPSCVEVLEEVDTVDANPSELRNQGPATYRVRPDLRRCAWPHCGGFWVSSVNERTTRCGSQGRADWCYTLDLIGLPSEFSANEELLVRGELETYDVAEFGEFSDLHVREAWVASSSAQGGGTFYEVSSTGIVCITSPCPSYEASELGRGRGRTLSGLNLSGAGASSEMMSAGYEAAGEGELIVAGELLRERVNGRWSYTLNATQFYVPAVANECLSTPECGSSAYTRPVESTEDCYCPTCPQAMNAEEAGYNQATWERHCSNVRLICPAVACFAPPGDPGCVDGQCVYKYDEI